MYRAASLRALVFSGMAVGLAIGRAGAQQSDPASAGQVPAKSSRGAAPQIRTRNGQVIVSPQQTTPAEQQYGLPRNPIVGGAVDTDLTKPLTLARALQIGLALQNSIAISQTQVDVANSQLTQAKSTLYPQITPSLQYSSGLSPTAQLSPTGQVVFGGVSSSSRTDLISAQQLLFDSGKREATISQSRRNTFAAAFGLGNTRQDVVLAITQDYYDLLRDRELLRAQKENEANAQLTETVIQTQATVGTAAQSDVLQTQADLANAHVAVLQAQTNYSVDEASLKNSMGVVTPAPLVLPDASVPEPSVLPDTTGVEPYVQLAYANRLDIKQQKENVYAQGYSVRIAKINAGLTVQANITEGYALDPNAGEERAFVVSVSYPLFDGGETRAVVHQNEAILEQQQRTLDQLEQMVRLAVDQAYVSREQARQTLVAARVAVNASQVNFNVQSEKQKNGLVNIPEVENAQVQLVTAKVSEIQAVYNYYVADAALKRQLGVNDLQYLPRVPGAKPPIPTPTTR